mgnify:FL=1
MQLITLFKTMEIENILAIIVPLVAIPIMALIGWFLKGLLKTIKEDLEKQSINIRKLSDRFADFQLSIQKVGSTLTAVEKDLDRANSNLGKTTSLAESNHDKIKDFQHDLGNVENNVKLIHEIVKEHADKIDSLEKKVFVLKNK